MAAIDIPDWLLTSALIVLALHVLFGLMLYCLSESASVYIIAFICTPFAALSAPIMVWFLEIRIAYRILLSIACIALYPLVVIVFWYIAIEALYYQGPVARKVQNDLGFEEGSACRSNGKNGYDSALSLKTVHSSSILEKSGLQGGDVLLSYSITDFYRQLHRHRGKTIELKVLSKNDWASFADDKLRTVTVAVPI